MIILIAAVAKNNTIGKNNDLPWDIPEDLQHYKKTTEGQTILMGQTTFESILKRGGKPLPNRKTIVVTMDETFKAPEGVEVRYDLDGVIQEYKNSNKDLYVSGGASIYRQTIDQADRLIITHVEKEVQGDTFFPEIDEQIWKKINENPNNGFSFVIYERK